MELYKSKYSDGKTDGRNSRRDNESYRSYRNSGDNRRSRDNDREDTTVTCSDCGDQCTVPFVPRTNKPVYCSDCFRDNKPEDSGNDRYSRDDRRSRSKSNRDSSSSYGRESSRDNSRSRKPRNDKFSKKQENFFANGSDKFYATIKEKLYEILGGKTCSNCGFKDERALGITPVSGNTSNDNGRGGDASSWGKYISSPDLAREDLKVLCLNCNQIREPESKPKENTPKPKKSKYFPR